MASQAIYNGGIGTTVVVPISGISNLACQCTVRGSGAVSATVTWYVNVDGTTDEWVQIGQTFANGTNVASDGFAAPLKPWQYIQAQVTALTGTGAYAVLKLGW